LASPRAPGGRPAPTAQRPASVAASTPAGLADIFRLTRIDAKEIEVIMDAPQFDRLVRQIAGAASRRQALRLLAGGALGLLAGLPSGAVATAQVEAASSCLKQGKDCKRGNQCCSGLCHRKQCRRAPGQGICTIRNDACRENDADKVCGGAGFNLCGCFVTAAGRSFCGSGQVDDAQACANDGECVTRLGDGARCVRGGPSDCPATPVCRRSCTDPFPG
jgi:hypothetical protein